MSDITGCIIRINHDDRAVCQAFYDEFKEDHIVDIVGNTFYMERMGNQEFEGWLLGLAGDLRVMRNRGTLPDFGDSLHIRLELVH